MLTYDELDRYFVENKICVVVYGGSKYNYSTREKKVHWKVQLEKVDDGIKLDVQSEGVSLYQTMYDAYEKFNRVATRGASNLLAPVIEHKTIEFDDGDPYNEPPSKVDIDDAIPF